MSRTIYDSPDGARYTFSIDITHEIVWFFDFVEEYDIRCVRVNLAELPAIYEAIGKFLAFEESLP